VPNRLTFFIISLTVFRDCGCFVCGDFPPDRPESYTLIEKSSSHHSLQGPSRAARQAYAMALRNAQEQRGKYLALELSSTRNPLEDMRAIVSKFQSAKIGVNSINGSLLVSFFSIHAQSITMEEKVHDHRSDPQGAA
jgi:hypothetical protein